MGRALLRRTCPFCERRFVSWNVSTRAQEVACIVVIGGRARIDSPPTARCSRGEPMTTWLHEWLFRRSSREDCHCCKRWALQEPGGPHLRREPLLDQALREQS